MLRGKRALALKAPITTAADETFWNIFSNFRKNEVWYSMRIVCWQAILKKHHAFFVIFEKAAKFELVVCCNLYVGGALWVFVAVYLFLVVKLCLAFHRSLHCLPNITILQRDTLSDNLCEQFDQDQDRSKLFDTLMVFLKDFLKKLILKKK